MKNILKHLLKICQTIRTNSTVQEGKLDDLFGVEEVFSRYLLCILLNFMFHWDFE